MGDFGFQRHETENGQRTRLKNGEKGRGRELYVSSDDEGSEGLGNEKSQGDGPCVRRTTVYRGDSEVRSLSPGTWVQL